MHDADSRLFTNFGLTAVGLAAGTLLPIANVGSAAVAQKLGIGIVQRFSLGWPSAFALVLIAFSFVAYWLHRWMHRSPLFWRIHRVHHADSVVDVSTALRNHPFELLVTLPVSALVVVVVGAPPSAVVAAQTAILASAIWQHADIHLPTGRIGRSGGSCSPRGCTATITARNGPCMTATTATFSRFGTGCSER